MRNWSQIIIPKEIPKKSSIFAELEEDENNKKEVTSKRSIFNELEPEKKSSIFKELEPDNKPSIFKELESENKGNLFKDINSNKKPSIFQELESGIKPSLFKELDSEPEFLKNNNPDVKNQFFNPIDNNLNEKPSELFSQIELPDPNKKRNRGHLLKNPEPKAEKLLNLAENAAKQDMFANFFDKDDNKPISTNIQSKLLPVKSNIIENKVETNKIQEIPQSKKPKNLDLEEEDLIL